MGRKKGGYPLIEGLEITSFAAEGKAMGLHDGTVVFVPMAVPGDVVDVQVRVKRRRYMEGYAVNYVRLSPLRTDPVCAHFGVCGGCKWQNIPYSEQLRVKREQVYDQLSRIGKVELPEIPPVLPSERTEFYRNKLEFTFSPRRWITTEEAAGGGEISDPEALGFHVAGMFDKVLDIKKCWLQPEPSNRIRLAVKDFCIRNGYTFYHPRERTGLMRNIIIRTSSSGEVMVVVVFARNETEKIVELMGFLSASFPEITSLIYIVNDKLNDSIADRDTFLYDGKDHITERMEGLEFKVGAKSFYQTNSQQAYSLYKTVRDFAELNPEDVVYDLYTGTGTIAIFLARGCRKVVGVEYVPEAIGDAKENSALNGITNTVFFAGDIKDVLNGRLIAENGTPDVVVIDPPRAGVHPSVIETLLQALPRTIVYVSCNPATQARDMAMLDAAYAVEKVQPVDMFPHTQHIENVVKLVRRRDSME